MEIRKTMSAIFQDGVDVGYKEKSNWWGDPSDKDAFRISSLDNDYPSEYFKQDHVSRQTVIDYCNCVIGKYQEFTESKLKSIIEFGSGGGWFTEEFKKRGYGILALEGSNEGEKKCIRRDVRRVLKYDFRYKMPPHIGKYDIALCTEVGEHIESPFSAILVANLVDASDIIWWSSAEPNVGRPHLHHPNEQPYQYWINLFKFYGYEAIRLSDEIFNACEYRGRYMFYNKSKFPQK